MKQTRKAWKFRSVAILALAMLAACQTVEDEQRSTITVDGRSYELRTQVVNGPNGPFERSRVVVRNQFLTCLPQSPGDCEATVRLARTTSDR
jgi:hypothetical protein